MPDRSLSSPWGAYRTTESGLLLRDTTIANASSAKHGLLPKLSGSSTDVLRGDGTWSALSGVGGAIPEWTLNDPQTAADSSGFLANDNFSVGSSIDTAGTRFTSATPWTARLVTTLTNAVANGALTLTLPATASAVHQGYTQPLPAGDCTYRTVLLFAGASANFQRIALLVERSTGASRKSLFLGLGFNSGISNEHFTLDRRSTDSDTFSATVASLGNLGPVVLRMPWWFEMEYSGTNLIFRWGLATGYNFRTLATEAEASFLGGRADRIGLVMLDAGGGSGSVVSRSLGFWRTA